MSTTTARPKNVRHQGRVDFKSYSASYPIVGCLQVKATDAGVFLVDFLPPDSPAVGCPSAHPLLAETHAWLSNYTATGIRGPLPKISPMGTEFQKRVWKALAALPTGEILSYQRLGAKIGMPNAPRCVGGAVGRNPLPVLIPCHRVLGANGYLGGFSGGLELKKALLRHEGLTWRE